MIITYAPGKPLPDLSGLNGDDRAYIEWYDKYFHESPIPRIDFVVGGEDVEKVFYWDEAHVGTRLYWEQWREKIIMQLMMEGTDMKSYAIVILPSHSILYANFLAAEYACKDLCEEGKDARVVKLILLPLVEYTGSLE